MLTKGVEMKIIHFSDVHYGKGWMFNHTFLTKGIEQINEIDAELIVITGDLTEWGLRPEFEGVKEELKQLNKPFLIVPGNHDARQTGFKTFKELFLDRKARFYTKELENFLMIGLDSSEPDIDYGHIGREQLAWLENVLEGQDKTPIVFLHHHLVSVPNTGRERNILIDACDVLELLNRFRVPLVLTGHKHVPWVWNLNGMVISSTGTISCERTTLPQSFNIVQIEQGRIRIEKVELLSKKRALLGEYNSLTS